MLPELQKYANVAYSNLDTIQNTYDLSVAALQVEGDFVECGVAAGAQIGVMGHVLQKFNSNKRIYAFDSYQGIPLAGKFDDQQPGIGALDPNRYVPENTRELLKSSGITVHSLANVRQNIGNNWRLDINKYNFIEGWFQDTLPVVAPQIRKIALLRLDGDLYESTKVCMDYLHDKIQKGGYVIVDDYALLGCQTAIKEYFDEHGLEYELKPVNPQAPEVHYYQVL